MNFINILTVTLTLFAVIDMLGNIPLIIKLRKEHGHIQSFKGSLIATLIMLSFLFGGEYLFNLLHLEISYFAIAGSFLLLVFGFRMVLGIEDSSSGKTAMNATVFPIAFPLIAGPGTLSTIISLRSDFSMIEISLGILINAIFIFIVLKSSNWIQNKMGESGITIMERVFGLILIAIGMKMLITNLVISINSLI